MKKYLVAFVIGGGLMANGPAFAETQFPGILSSQKTVLSMCIAAAENGVDVGHQELSPNETYSSIEIQAFLTSDGEDPLLYFLVTKVGREGDFDFLCYEALPKEQDIKF